MPFGVYVHIPYCVKKCPYCDFNSYGVGKRVPEKEYTESILKELDLYRGSIEGVPISSIFFGGGTPSLFSPESIGKITGEILKLASPLDAVEVSLEVNPKTANLGKLSGLRDAGINRISVGVQSFSERKLKLLGRINTPDNSRRILDDIVKAGFDNFNLDLMFGVSFETIDEWRVDLEEALRFNTTHISAYCLTVEDNTEFGILYSNGKLPLLDEDALTEMLSFTSGFLENNDYRRYEISNFAKPGFECRHNLLYWKGEDYIGLGAGAHSHISSSRLSPWGVRWANLNNPDVYMKAVLEGKRPLAFTEYLEKEEAIEDKILMGLRLQEGISLTSIKERFGIKLRSDKLDSLIDGGFLVLSGDLIRLSRNGVLVSNELIMRVIDSLILK
ncbi:MAG: coproporphyrinogen III oxidase [Candidatus Dadabacteria bacterium]